MQPDLNRVIEQVSKEKGIDRALIVEALENAMVSAARKTFGPERRIEGRFNPELGEVELFEIKTVVAAVDDAATQLTLEESRSGYDPEAEVGDELLTKLPSEKFGRIAAQAAKQNIVQRVRDAERDIIYNEFKDRKAELFSGIVQRFEKKNMIVNLGRTDAILPEKEQIPRERYRQGDRIRAYIVEVEMTGKGPQIILSRTHPGLLIKLFEQEVPEIYEGIVEVKGAVREPGGRAKIAVISTDPDVDPVGACVGMRGTRVQAVVQELRGEKIDIVHWTPDPAEYVCRALQPAKVSKILMDEEGQSMEVIVPDDQLSLAIGRKGHNVRLASKLSGWQLDVRSESEAEEEARRARASLTGVPEIGDLTAELLYQSGFKSAEEVAQADVQSVADIDGVGAERAPAIVESARGHVVELQEAAERAAAEAAAAAEAEAAALAARAAAGETVEAGASGEAAEAEAVESEPAEGEAPRVEATEGTAAAGAAEEGAPSAPAAATDPGAGEAEKKAGDDTPEPPRPAE